SLVPASALAQADGNYDPALLQAAHSVDTPEKMGNVIDSNFHVRVSQTWPTNFPVPVYNSNVLRTSFTYSTKGPPTAGATLATRDQPSQVLSFYQSACISANWKVKVPSQKALAELSPNGDILFLSAEQGKQVMNITCTRNPKTDTTNLSISWQKKP
ncbi:MAG: hypothetical protein ACRD3W_26605, partial [Terriglobales bacterium]